MTENYPDYLFEEATRREKENEAIIAKISDEDLKKVQEAQQQYKGEQQ